MGHHGLERTLKKLHNTQQQWDYMRQHIKMFIKQCPYCQKASVIKPQILTHPYTTASYEPMEKINIDTIGPFDPDDEGNTYIITIIDCFTRWIELYACKDATAATAARALLQHTGRFAAPYRILSDNGSQYINKLITEYLQLINTEHTRTLAYSHEENGMVERANKEVLRHLRAIVFDKNIVHRWSDCLPFVQRIINANIDSSIGVTPASLLFGNAITLERGILFPFRKEDPQIISVGAAADKMLNIQQEVIRIAKHVQTEKDKTHILAGDTTQTEFAPNTYVLVEYDSSIIRKGPPNKLNTNLKGPLKVLGHIGPTYRLENLVTGKVESIHITRLRPYIYDPEQQDLTDIANRDEFATVVESIVEHVPVMQSYKSVKCSELQFRVRWRGLSEEFDRYLPYKELRNNPRLHEYLTKNNMKSYIPREHK